MNMAEGDTAKWPSPITFDDDDPKVGFAFVTLKMKEFKVEKSLVGKAKPKNADVNVKFETESVSVEVKIKDGDGVHYVYKKNLPVDIIPENSEYKIKDGRVILVLCKAKKVSWAAHADYFLKRQ